MEPWGPAGPGRAIVVGPLVVMLRRRDGTRDGDRRGAGKRRRCHAQGIAPGERKRGQIYFYDSFQAKSARGRFGSLAVVQHLTSRTSAFGRIADTQQRFLEGLFLNVCFHLKRPFRSVKIHQYDSPLSAKSGPNRSPMQCILLALFRPTITLKK